MATSLYPCGCSENLPQSHHKTCSSPQTRHVLERSMSFGQPSSTTYIAPGSLVRQTLSSALVPTSSGASRPPPPSRRSTSSNDNQMQDEWEDWDDDDDDDDDDGSVVLVRNSDTSGRKDGAAGKGSALQIFNLAGSKLAMDLSRALNASASNGKNDKSKEKESETKKKDQGPQKEYFSHSAIFGLTIAMRLYNELSNLRDIVEVYRDYDDCSRNLFRLDRHNDMHSILTTHLTTILATTTTLSHWSTIHPSPLSPTHPASTLLSLASYILHEWSTHATWLADKSDKGLKHWSPIGGAPWVLRRRQCRRTMRFLLKYLDGGYRGDGLEGVRVSIAEWGRGLRKEWKDEGRLDKREVWDRGWAWVRGDMY